MKLFLRMICAAMLLGLCVVPATAQRADVYVWVSTVGDNMADGTETAPLASVQQALAKVRALRETADPETLGDVHIVLRSGTYRLTETLRLTAEDSGTPASATIIEAEAGGTVVLSGGVEITGWQAQGDVEGLPSVAQGQVWVAEVPCVGSTAVPFRQMWIGNNKMRRAGTFDGKTLPRIISVNKERGELIVPRPAQTFARPDRVEMTIIQDWVTNVMRVERISTAADRSVFTFKQPESGIEFKRPWPILRADASSSTNHMFYLSNAIELLNHPQEWFCDTDQGLVYYWRPAPPGAEPFFYQLLIIDLCLQQNLLWQEYARRVELTHERGKNTCFHAQLLPVPGIVRPCRDTCRCRPVSGSTMPTPTRTPVPAMWHGWGVLPLLSA